MTALLDNMTYDELLRFGLVPEFIDRTVAPKGAELQAKIDDAVYDETEVLREQISNAQALLDQLESGVDRLNKMSEFRKFFRDALENTYFER